MEDNIQNKYTYQNNYIHQNNLKNQNIYNSNHDLFRNYNNYNRQFTNKINNENCIDANNEDNSHEKRFFLINEINELKKKYFMAKERLEFAKNQKEKDVKYIENLEKEILLKNKNNNPYKHLLYNKYIKIPKNNNIYQKERNENNKNNKNIYYNNNKYVNNSKLNTNDTQRIKMTKSYISDFSLYDNSSFNNSKKNIREKTSKNSSKTNTSNISSRKKIKRNNSVILNKTWFNNKNNLKNINNSLDIFTFNQNSKNEENADDKNKIIIRNCNCIINLNPENVQNNKYLSVFKNTKSQNNSNSKKNINITKKNIEKKRIMQERYLIIDERQKPIYTNGKQVLGMNLMPLKGDNDEIILDNENNIFLYDLDGHLHNQNDLKNIILANGVTLVNENNIPILGINNIPIVDEYGDFLLDKEPIYDEDDNSLNVIFADVLRDRDGKPIKILIEKKDNNLSNEKENFNNISFNQSNYQNSNSSKNMNIKYNPIVEIEINPYTKLITNKDKTFYYYLKKSQMKQNSSYNENNRFNFEKSLRNYNIKKNNKNKIYNLKKK